MVRYGATPKYKKEYYEKNKQRLQKNSKECRLIRRRKIQAHWGTIGGTIERDLWKQAEYKAEEYLKSIGVENVKHLAGLFPFFPFDIFGILNGEKTLFQVTVRTHVGDIKRHKELANLLEMKYKVIYVKPNFSYFVITESTEIGVKHIKGDGYEE